MTREAASERAGVGPMRLLGLISFILCLWHFAVLPMVSRTGQLLGRRLTS